MENQKELEMEEEYYMMKLKLKQELGIITEEEMEVLDKENKKK